MNELPSKYFDVVREASGGDVPLMNATEDLEHLFGSGVRESDLPEIQPLFHDKVIRPGMLTGEGGLGSGLAFCLTCDHFDAVPSLLICL